MIRIILEKKLIKKRTRSATILKKQKKKILTGILPYSILIYTIFCDLFFYLLFFIIFLPTISHHHHHHHLPSQNNETRIWKPYIYTTFTTTKRAYTGSHKHYFFQKQKTDGHHLIFSVYLFLFVHILIAIIFFLTK